MRREFGEFIISDDKALLIMDVIYGFLERSYWANKRPRATTDKAIAGSVCYGVYHGDRQVGFARVVTDSATVYYLCDVFIDEDYRGSGIGKKLIETITQSDEYRNLQGMLRTNDAHTLYEQYGFERDEEKFMRKAPDYLR